MATTDTSNVNESNKMKELRTNESILANSKAEKRPNDEMSAPTFQPPKKKKTSARKKGISQATLDVRRRIQQCCKNNDLYTAMEAYDEAISQSTTIEAQSFYNLLNLCDGLQDRGVHIGTPKPQQESSEQQQVEQEGVVVEVRPVDTETRIQYAFRIKQHMDQLDLALNETAYTALVRLMSKAKLFQEAESLLKEAETIQQCKPRLRLYSSLLCAYCEEGQMEQALQLWARLSEKSLVLTEREYAALISCASKTGDANIMERVLSDLAEDVLVPSRDTTRFISEWFSSEHARIKEQANGGAPTSVPRCSVELPASDAPSMGPVQCKGDETGWIVTSGCTVDTSTGQLTSGCLKGESLQPVSLSQEQWDEMMEMNETIVKNGMLDSHTSQFQGGGKGPKRHPSKQKGGVEKRLSNWKAFETFFERKGAFDVVIDGANVGYYKQNFANAPRHVDYRQIDSLLQHFVKEKKKVLLVMHERHFYPKLMPSWAVPIVDSWKGVLYRTPSGMNDDWFWLHAALKSGRETLVVTNDEMRDHFFQMLAPRSFLRWKERHQIHFNFEWNGNSRVVELTYPERYSRRIQRVAHGGLVVPLPKRGDEHRYLDGAHVANDEYPEEETYLCIRPNKV